MSGTIHATCVAIDGRGVLLVGRSGAGKSDLALRLVDRGAVLVSDDRCLVEEAAGGRLVARAPATIAGRIEVRGLGIIDLPHAAEATVSLLVDLEQVPDRMPEPATRPVAGVAIPVVAFAPFEPSTPFKVELALRALGR